MIHLFDSVSAHARSWLVVAACVLVAGAVAAVWLLGVPVSNVLLLLLVLACPLSHLLLGHGGHDHSHSPADRDSGFRTSAPNTGDQDLRTSGNS